MYITLDECLHQLQIDPFTDEEKESDPTLQQDEDYITALIEVCETVVENDINCSLADYVVDEKLAPPLRHSILLMVRHMYDHRSPVDHQTAKQVSLSYDHLIRPYRNYEL